MPFQLERYKGKATRYTCPACGHRQRFTRYIDDSGNHLADDVGRCDRETSCGYHKKPREFFAANPATTAAPRRERLKVWTKPPDFIDQSYVKVTLQNYEQNSFVRFLLMLWPENPRLVWDAVKKYLIGTFGEKVVFWQIDANGRIRTGKIMLYGPDGKRRAETYVKDGQTVEKKIDWVHTVLKRTNAIGPDFNLFQCWFGEHLTTQDLARPVAIVEAEKTAVIASIGIPEFIWIAAGSVNGLSVERLKIFKDRRVILFPDAKEFGKWAEIAKAARSNGIDVMVSDLVETKATDEQKGKGYDIADFIIAERLSGPENAKRQAAIDKAIDRIVAIPELASRFERIIDERKAALMVRGNLTDAEAERLVCASESLRSAAAYFVEGNRFGEL